MSKTDLETPTLKGRAPAGASLPSPLPMHLRDLLEAHPANVDRRAGAVLVTKHLFPISHRTLEAWSLPTRVVNGKAVVPTRTLLEMAYAKFEAAPVIMSGRRTGTHPAAATEIGA
jgi:hypothetical protein